ncbi:MAG TPA: hypothetical protein VKX28_05605 [Xanthobacteraceae bacterium]|nr:hypothetical protein [Xanthobacteraceae bacterium]
MTDARTKTVNSHRQRLRNRRLKRVEVQVPAREAEVIRKAAAMLRDRPKRRSCAAISVSIRHRMSPNPPSMSFFMKEDPSPHGEALWGEAMRNAERIRKDPALNRLRDFDP